MKKQLLSLLSLLAAGVVLIWPTQAQDTTQELFTVVNSLKQQQVQITDNQAKLDQKIADVSESVRVARIFMSRAGGKHKPPK